MATSTSDLRTRKIKYAKDRKFSIERGLKDEERPYIIIKMVDYCYLERASMMARRASLLGSRSKSARVFVRSHESLNSPLRMCLSAFFISNIDLVSLCTFSTLGGDKRMEDEARGRRGAEALMTGL